MFRLALGATLLLGCNAIFGVGDYVYDDETIAGTAASGPGASTGVSAAGGSSVSAGGSARGGGGGNGAAGTGAMGAGSACDVVGTKVDEADLLFFSALDDTAALASPQVGDGTGSEISTSPDDDFVTIDGETGIRLDAGGEHVLVPQLVNSVANISWSAGTLDLCYYPLDEGTGERHLFVLEDENSGDEVTLERTGPGGYLRAEVNVGGHLERTEIKSNDYALPVRQWHRLTLAWDLSTTTESNARLYVNGVEPPPAKGAGPYTYQNVPSAAEGQYFRLGSLSDYHPHGMIGAIAVYDDAIDPP